MTTLHQRIIAAGMADCLPLRILAAGKRGWSLGQWVATFLMLALCGGAWWVLMVVV